MSAVAFVFANCVLPSKNVEFKPLATRFRYVLVLICWLNWFSWLLHWIYDWGFSSLSSAIKLENLFTSNIPASFKKRWSELKLGLWDKKYSRWSTEEPIPKLLISCSISLPLIDSSQAVVNAWRSLKLYDFFRTSIWFLKSVIDNSSPLTFPMGSGDWNPLPSKTPAITNANNAIPITAIRTKEFFLRFPKIAIIKKLVNENTNISQRIHN